jgi:hypothetical protein
VSIDSNDFAYNINPAPTSKFAPYFHKPSSPEWIATSEPLQAAEFAYDCTLSIMLFLEWHFKAINKDPEGQWQVIESYAFH